MMEEGILALANAWMATWATGLARAAYEEALTYCKERVQGGRPLAEHYSIKQRIFEMFARVETCRALSRAAINLNMNIAPGFPEYSMAAKITATQLCLDNASDAIQLLGGNGLSKEYLPEKLFRDATGNPDRGRQQRDTRTPRRPHPVRMLPPAPRHHPPHRGVRRDRTTATVRAPRRTRSGPRQTACGQAASRAGRLRRTPSARLISTVVGHCESPKATRQSPSTTRSATMSLKQRLTDKGPRTRLRRHRLHHRGAPGPLHQGDRIPPGDVPMGEGPGLDLPQGAALSKNHPWAKSMAVLISTTTRSSSRHSSWANTGGAIK